MFVCLYEKKCFTLTCQNETTTLLKIKIMSITKETTAAIRKALSIEFPKKEGWKFSVRKGIATYTDTLNVVILEAPLNLLTERAIENDRNNETVTCRPYEMKASMNINYTQEQLDVFNRVNEIVTDNTNYFDKSDSMTDYFHVAYFYNLKVGQWDKDFKVNEIETVEAPKCELTAKEIELIDEDSIANTYEVVEPMQEQISNDPVEDFLSNCVVVDDVDYKEAQNLNEAQNKIEQIAEKIDFSDIDDLLMLRSILEKKKTELDSFTKLSDAQYSLYKKIFEVLKVLKIRIDQVQDEAKPKTSFKIDYKANKKQIRKSKTSGYTTNEMVFNAMVYDQMKNNLYKNDGRV